VREARRERDRFEGMDDLLDAMGTKSWR